jgi:hypothetical protein
VREVTTFEGDYMNRSADRLLIVLCSFALIALLLVPLEENGKAPLLLLVSSFI